MKKLNVLLVKTYEAEQVYKLGALLPLIRNIMKGMVQKRHSFSLELQEEIRAYGQLPLKQEDLQAPALRNSLITPGEVTTMNETACSYMMVCWKIRG